MRDQSRRQFIESCFCLAASGIGAGLLSFCTGCRKREDSAILPAPAGDAARLDPGFEPGFEPGYLKLHASGELKKRGVELWSVMENCALCPRGCGANRLEGEEGFCEGSSRLEIASFHPHFGEERSLVGRGGSGTVFFTNCGLRCVFCINGSVFSAPWFVPWFGYSSLLPASAPCWGSPSFHPMKPISSMRSTSCPV